jgi:hypothetical protein
MKRLIWKQDLLPALPPSGNGFAVVFVLPLTKYNAMSLRYKP